MGTGQNVSPLQIAILIDSDLNPTEQFRHALNFIDNKRRWMLTKKCRTIFYGLPTNVRIFEIHIGIIRETHSHKGCFA